MKLSLQDAFGGEEILAEERAGVYRIEAEALEGLEGQLLYLKVMATGFERSQHYRLRLEAEALLTNCEDPDLGEPRDHPWEAQELFSTLGLIVEGRIEGQICRQDEDWYHLWLDNGDLLNLNFQPEIESGLLLRILGPETPAGPIAREQARQEGPGRINFEPSPLSCNLTEAYCETETGLQTQLFCARSPEGVGDRCDGASYYIQILGPDGAAQGDYVLNLELLRAQDRDCIPDLVESNEILDGNFPERMYAFFNPAAMLSIDGEPSITYDFPYEVSFRVCGADGEEGVVEWDTTVFWLEAGEIINVELHSDDSLENQGLFIHFYNWGDDVIRLASVDIHNSDFQQQFQADSAGRHSITLGRGVNRAHDDQYNYSLNVDLSLRHLRANIVEDQHCNDLSAPINFLFNPNSEVRAGTTAGSLDDYQPQSCIGGQGPDRVYAVDLPGEARGVLVARVVATQEDGYDPAVSIQSDCGEVMAEMVCNEDDLSASDPLRQAEVSATLMGGQRIFVVVDSYSVETAGSYRLTLEWAPL